MTSDGTQQVQVSGSGPHPIDIMAGVDGTDPSKAPEKLGLSGTVIIATAIMPYKFSFGNGEWEISQRRGNSALNSSFSHLASGTSWNTVIVGWPGEVSQSIGKRDVQKEHQQAEGGASTAPVQAVTASSYQQHSAELEQDVVLSKQDRVNLEEQLSHEGNELGKKIVPVWVVGEKDGDIKNGDVVLKDQNRWVDFAQREIWPTFHYLLREPTDGRKERTWWADYIKFNQAFADKIFEVYKPGDIVWIHDYQLLLVPSMLRQKLSSAYIAFFLHSPFPSSEFFRCMTKRKELLAGVLGANQLGFQSYAYAKHFISSCTRVLGFESSGNGVDAYGAHVAVDVFPIGIDAAKVEKDSHNANIDEKMQAIRELAGGKKIIVGRDRLDSVRGVVQKLRAFEMFLELYPEWRDKVILIQVTSPSVSEGPKVEHQVSELVAHINGTYGSIHFSPVQHFPQYLSQDEYYALLRVADLGLITSVRDGMNTTSLEYVVCQKETHGPVILSEFTGTAGSLCDAFQVNPWDYRGVAEAINTCLSLPAETKEELHSKLYEHVSTHNIQNWTNTFLKGLLTNLASHDQSQATPPLDRQALLDQYNKSTRRLFMFDYDGTLTPIVKDPQAAIPTDKIIRTIKTLASDPQNNVWIVSGRDQAFLEQWMGDIAELGFSAEHGSFVRRPRDSEWVNLTEKFDMSWQKDVLDIFQYYTERTQGSFIERKRCALTWHYRRADPDYGAFQARECQSHLENTVMQNYDVEVMTGKANLEVRPTFVNKGEIAKKLVAEYPEDAKPDFVLCLGDDTTDEDMFRALRRSTLPTEHVFAVTIGASTKMTLASWHLQEPADVIDSVRLLIGDVDEVPAAPSGEAEGKEVTEESKL
ncbi:threalose-6-phosphate phosphatase [Orbilia oligospora]|uniref:Threalose-6-phosphate phosphatase n=2 Tax=Orbilia oligospora TaxID=2813651 RepID=A0A7C8JWW8_ORBOL|nr:threalose-6-phosphate phosphatase [Orbilia oligospora]KAF3101481.1 threalose-6-phosphate phosphatase [Orbilia oligospora]KAF3127747.1 threalose-6-phosphate phosphatase [Orbilia oligospora]KAF3136993.1 threalose-6-phosphate phosphatase [Orbilia oligospora]KAF3148616.1 threalose-6-phosphate phosphatase [Orbilia oligospora]